jgi:hypothetical protein
MYLFFSSSWLSAPEDSSSTINARFFVLTAILDMDPDVVDHSSS